MPTKTCPDDTALLVRPDVLLGDTDTDVVCREGRDGLGLFAVVEAGEAAIHRWLMRYSITALRISMGTVILGFGILKYFPGVSPAQDLVLTETEALTFGLVPGSVALVLLATVECAIGLLLITGRWLLLTIYLTALWALGILSPTAVLTGREFAGPHHMPTLEGQYVLKDVILLTAIMVIATTVRSGATTDDGRPPGQTR